MDKPIFIYQHLGLGDHILCNGLIRSLVKPDCKYAMFVKPDDNNYSSVSYMYRDLKNVEYIKAEDTNAVLILKKYGIDLNDHVKTPNPNLHLIGFHWPDDKLTFEQNFYHQNNVPFENKWSKFFCERDSELEQKIYDHYNINEDYIFVHDDHRFKINENRLPKGIRVIRPQLGLTNNVFAYAKLIENAKSVHCIESSFGFMVDGMGINREFYVHRYARYLGWYHINLHGTYKNHREILV